MNETTRVSLAVFLTLIWLLWCIGLFVRYKRKQPKRNLAATTLIAYASQSGSAAALAIKKAQQIGAGVEVNLLPLDKVCKQTLQATQQAHFIVSTYGNGEPPDNGQRFYHDLTTKKLTENLSHLRYSITALGDSSYEHFCAFGHALNVGLSGLGAKLDSDVVEIDSQKIPIEDIACTPHPAQWSLQERKCLNPNSKNAPLYLLSFNSEDTSELWQAGDVISLQPRHGEKQTNHWLEQHKIDGTVKVTIDNAEESLSEYLRNYHFPDLPPHPDSHWEQWLNSLTPLPHREYSIASAQHEKQLKLIVRLQSYPDGTPGIGSGWLTQYSNITDVTHGVIRSNSRCHINSATRPLLLIGAGSGLAGVRAQLAQRAIKTNAGPVWVIYGERHPEDDAMLAEELYDWQKQGVITDLHFAYSQHTQQPAYVQDLLHSHSKKLKAFIHKGADIYICGNKSGMGDGVHQVLTQYLGNENITALLSSGRYRRDLY